MAAKIDLTTKKRFLEIPERKRFGWSPYMQEILKIQFPRNAVKVMAQEAVIRGKKIMSLWEVHLGLSNRGC